MRPYVKAALLASLILPALPDSPAGAAVFNNPVVVSSDNISEPGIAVAPNGTIYVHGPRGIPLNSVMWRSTNGGASFTPTSGLTRLGLGGGDMHIAVQPNGKLAFTDLWLGSSSVGSSTNQGDTWIANQMQGTLVQDRQWVATTGNDIVYHVTHELAAGLVVSKSVDGGVTYPIQTLAASTLDQNFCICPSGYFIAESGADLGGLNDKIGVAYTTQTGVGFARSINGGLTWARTAIDTTGGASTMDAFPVIANAGGNKLVAVWLETTNSSSRVMFSSSANWGAPGSWSPPTAIVSTGSSVFPWVDAEGGKVSVSLYHTTATGGPDKVANSALWYLKYLESNDGGATFAALDTADALSVKSGPICTDGLNCGSDRELGDFQMLVLDNNGKANISYARSLNGSTDTEVRFVKQA